MHARFSLPTCLSALAIHGRLVADTFLPDQLADPRMAAGARLVSLTEVPEFTSALPTERPASVTISWRDGQSSTATVRNARGNPDQPLSLKEIEAKFAGNVGALIESTAAISLLRSAADAADPATGHLATVARQLTRIR